MVKWLCSRNFPRTTKSVTDRDLAKVRIRMLGRYRGRFSWPLHLLSLGLQCLLVSAATVLRVAPVSPQDMEFAPDAPSWPLQITLGELGHEEWGLTTSGPLSRTGFVSYWRPGHRGWNWLSLWPSPPYWVTSLLIRSSMGPLVRGFRAGRIG
jgi:hypothetical protein